MSGRELNEAWQLIDVAKGTANLTRRRLLIKEAYELLQRAKQLQDEDEPAEEEQFPGLELYRIWLSRNRGEALWIFLQVENRADAFWAADSIAAVCADEYEEFELWHGSTFLFSGETKHSCFSLQTGFDVCLASQLSVLETEDALLSSRRALVRSRKLLAAAGELRDAVAARQPHS
jgi:hypothetical protein